MDNFHLIFQIKLKDFLFEQSKFDYNMRGSYIKYNIIVLVSQTSYKNMLEIIEYKAINQFLVFHGRRL